MPQNFFITGMPKAGKTTLLRRLIKDLESRGLRVGGFISPEEKHHGTRTAFYIENIRSGERAVLASVDGSGPKVSKYHVNIKSFEGIALPIMKNLGKYDVLIIDEIGRMEMKSLKFSDMLDAVFEQNTPVVATLHNDFVNRYSVAGEIHTLTDISREAVHLTMLKKITSAYIEKSKKPALKSKPKKASKKKTKGKKRAGKSAKSFKKPAKASKTKTPGKKTEKQKTAKKPSTKAEKKEKAESGIKRGFRDHIRDLLGF